MTQLKTTLTTRCRICGLLTNNLNEQDIINHVINNHQSKFTAWFVNKFIDIIVKTDDDNSNSNNDNNKNENELGKKLVKELDKALDEDAGNDTTNSINNNMDEVKEPIDDGV